MSFLLPALVVALVAAGGLAWYAYRLAAEVRQTRARLAQCEATLEDDEDLDGTGPDRLAPPRRREVAAFACELRGFAAFAASSAPKAVHGVLDEYVELLCRSLSRHGATVSGFTGDRLVAFFDDDLHSEDPVLRAMTMATEIQRSMDRLLQRWPSGYDLGLGSGIALGLADIGIVSFDGRHECSAVGPAINLVGCLCDEARSGEILIDERAHAVLQSVVRVEDSAVVSLPGVREPALAISARLLADADGVIAS